MGQGRAEDGTDGQMDDGRMGDKETIRAGL